MGNQASNIGSATLAVILAVVAHGEDENASDGIDVLAPFNVIGQKSDVLELEGAGTVLDVEDLKPFFHVDVTEILRQAPG
ncbi:MAG: hypothetical protein VB997_02605, partial [Opitutales bacterium]